MRYNDAKWLGQEIEKELLQEELNSAEWTVGDLPTNDPFKVVAGDALTTNDNPYAEISVWGVNGALSPVDFRW